MTRRPLDRYAKLNQDEFFDLNVQLMCSPDIWFYFICRSLFNKFQENK